MINTIKGKVQKLIGLQETYPSVFKEVSRYALDLNKHTKQTNVQLDIIMPSFDRLSVLKRAVDFLLKNTSIKFNLIIVDNNSNSETKKYLRNLNHQNIRVIFEHRNLGGSGARMAGLQLAKSEYVAFVDNDIFPMPFYFENLIKTLEDNKEIAAVQSKVVYPNRLIQINRPSLELDDKWLIFFDKDLDKKYNDPSTELSEEIHWMPSGATLWRRSVFEKESFDEEFKTSYEDNEFSYRLSKKGYKFMNNHKAICLHLSSQFTPSSVSKAYTENRFGNDIVLNSLKEFKKKHKFYLSFGDKEKFSKYMGFDSSQKFEDIMELE